MKDEQDVKIPLEEAQRLRDLEAFVRGELALWKFAAKDADESMRAIDDYASKDAQ